MTASSPTLPANFELAIAVESGGWPDWAEPLAETSIATAITELAPKILGPAELSLLMTDDAAQRDLNAQWRQKDQPTNVLSFPQIEPFAPLSGLLGDISLARETLEREAEAAGTPLEHHFAHLVVHGFLHILGYDHESAGEALVMEGLETKILARMGIADPYAGSDPVVD